MKYMVMECHPGYAVVLDEEGQFIKVANMRYQVGQTVTDVSPLQIPAAVQAAPRKRNVRWLYTLAAAAACLLLVLLPGLKLPQAAYASVYLTINPEVRIDVDQNDMVVGLEGVNADGIALIAGYPCQGKPLDLVVDALVDRAIEMGFLSDGGKVTLALDGTDQAWIVSHTDTLTQHLNDHLSQKMTVIIEVCDKHVHHDGDDHDDHDDFDDYDDHDDHDDSDDYDDYDDHDDHDDFDDHGNHDDHDDYDDHDDFDDHDDHDDFDDYDNHDDEDDPDDEDEDP